MTYILGQALGLLATVGCLVQPLFRRKRQMLLCSALINLLSGINLLLIGQPRSLPIYMIAVVQIFVMLYHNRRDLAVAYWENVLFLLLYIICGLLGARYAVDLLPVLGSVFHMLATFQTDEQKTRYILFANSATFCVYYGLIGSSTIFSTIVTMIFTVIAIIRYHKSTV